jgi:hypothetical protein
MKRQLRELYRRSNGDRWLLCREASGRGFVMHEPNLASGGAPSEREVGTFLATGGRGPEKQELLRIIGTLTENDNHES